MAYLDDAESTSMLYSDAEYIVHGDFGNESEWWCEIYVEGNESMVNDSDEYVICLWWWIYRVLLIWLCRCLRRTVMLPHGDAESIVSWKYGEATFSLWCTVCTVMLRHGVRWCWIHSVLQIYRCWNLWRTVIWTHGAHWRCWIYSDAESTEYVKV